MGLSARSYKSQSMKKRKSKVTVHEMKEKIMQVCKLHQMGSGSDANSFQLATELFSDSVFYALAKLIPGLLTLLSVSIFMRTLGPERYGHWAICNALVMLITGLCFGWIRQAILRFKSGASALIRFTRNEGPVPAILLGIALTSAIAILSLIFLRSFLGNLWITLPVSLFLLFFAISFGVFNVWDSYLQAWRKRSTMVLAETSRAAIGLIPAMFLASYWGVSGVLAGHGLGALSTGCLLIFILKRRYPLQIVAPTTSERPKEEDNWTNWWTYGWPVSMWLALLAFIPIFDRILIQSYLGISQSGVYAASYDIIVRGYSLFLFPVTLAVHPRIMAALNSGKADVAFQHLNFAKAVTFGIVILSCLGILVLYPIFFSYIVKVDANNSLSRLVLIAIALGGGGWQIALLAHKPLEMFNKTKLMVAGLIVALVVDVVFQLAFLKALGVIATPLALILSAIAYICFCWYWSDKLDKPRNCSTIVGNSNGLN